MTNPAPIYQKLKYVSAPCGAGKTTSICNLINSSTDNTERFIIVQNTQELIKDTAKDLKDCKYIITESVNKNESVINAVVEFLKTPNVKTLLITDKTFFKIPVDLLSSWTIYIDDVTNFHSFQNINEPDQNAKNIIFNNLVHNIEVLDNKNTYISAKKNPDIQGDVIQHILEKFPAFNENDVFIMNNEYFTDPAKSQLNITAWKDLYKYDGLSITFLGANFKNSLIYKGNQALFESITLDGLQERKTPLETRLKVYYFSEKIKLSGTWKKDNPDEVQKIYDYLEKELEGQDFYWTKNKGDPQTLHCGKEISPDARGFNKYSEFSTCVWLACMRPSDTEAKQCELFFKISSGDIHQAREYESLHQFVLRGISRDFDSTETQIVYVFDKWQASTLTDNIEYIDLGIDDKEQGQRGRPQGSMNRAKRFTLDDTKSTRFRRWKDANPELKLEAFMAFLASTTNADLSTQERDAMYKKYEKEVKKSSGAV